MKQVLEQDEATRDWLLAALVSHHPNLVDNMTTKDNLTYSQLKVPFHQMLKVEQVQLLLQVIKIITMERSASLIAVFAHQIPQNLHPHQLSHAPGARHATLGMKGTFGRSAESSKP